MHVCRKWPMSCINDNDVLQCRCLLVYPLDERQKFVLNNNCNRLTIAQLIGYFSFLVRWIHRAYYCADTCQSKPTHYKLRAIRHEQADSISFSDSETE